MKLREWDDGNNKEIVTVMLFEVLGSDPTEPEEVRRRICRRYDLSPYGGTEGESPWWNTLRQAARDLEQYVHRPPGSGNHGPWWLTPRGLRLKERILARDAKLTSFWSENRWMRHDVLRALKTRSWTESGRRRPREESILDSPRLARILGKKR